jgi:hypothetical protein
MSVNAFMNWFYGPLHEAIGGWLIFLVLALVALIWLLYDSANRRIPALGWKLGVIVAAILLVPAIVYKLANLPALAPYTLEMFYLGLLGGILPVVLAIGYYVAYQGMVVCPNGHVYEAVLGACPYDPIPGASGNYEGGGYTGEDGGTEGPRGETGAAGVRELEPPKPKAPAWLVTGDGREHQLNKGVTLIGRAARNDIVLDDPTVGREHAKIIEENGIFRLHDLGSANHTFINDERLDKAVILEADDKIGFGRKLSVKFVFTRR